MVYDLTNANLTELTYNGSDITRLFYNGVKVWNKLKTTSWTTSWTTSVTTSVTTSATTSTSWQVTTSFNTSQATTTTWNTSQSTTTTWNTSRATTTSWNTSQQTTTSWTTSVTTGVTTGVTTSQSTTTSWTTSWSTYVEDGTTWDFSTWIAPFNYYERPAGYGAEMLSEWGDDYGAIVSKQNQPPYISGGNVYGDYLANPYGAYGEEGKMWYGNHLNGKPKYVYPVFYVGQVISFDIYVYCSRPSAYINSRAGFYGYNNGKNYGYTNTITVPFNTWTTCSLTILALGEPNYSTPYLSPWYTCEANTSAIAGDTIRVYYDNIKIPGVIGVY